MVQICESIMLICFGLSWPFNIVRSYKSRTAKGKSVCFECLVVVGYISGLLGKFIGGSMSYVVVVYILDLLMVCTDLCLTIRNVGLDRRAEQAKAEEETRA